MKDQKTRIIIEIDGDYSTITAIRSMDFIREAARKVDIHNDPTITIEISEDGKKWEKMKQKSYLVGTAKDTDAQHWCSKNGIWYGTPDNEDDIKKFSCEKPEDIKITI